MKYQLTQTYQKPHTSLAEQVETLISRGLIVDDQASAEHYLSIIGYYRLSSYCYRFETSPTNGERSHQFLPETTFNDIINVYVFDQRLRSLMLEALERFEIFARSVWSHELSSLLGAHPHMSADNFSDKKEYFQSFLSLMEETERAKGSSEEIRHYINRYTEPFLPPVWIIVSIMSFGELFRWIKNTKSQKVKNNVAKHLGMPNTQVFEGVTRVLTTVRNICAHHGRLWDRRLSTRLPYITKNLRVPMVSVQGVSGIESDPRLFNVIVILAHIMVWINKDSSWPKRVASLVSANLSEREQKIMGFPQNWQSNSFWGFNGQESRRAFPDANVANF